MMARSRMVEKELKDFLREHLNDAVIKRLIHASKILEKKKPDLLTRILTALRREKRC
jgi:hypothetical protein